MNTTQRLQALYPPIDEDTKERILEKVKGETIMRTIRKDIQAIHTATRQIFLADDQTDGQVFYETRRAWEIWTTGKYERRIARFPKSKVFFTLSVDGEAWESC
jgi:hypothetical protein